MKEKTIQKKLEKSQKSLSAVRLSCVSLVVPDGKDKFKQLQNARLLKALDRVLEATDLLHQFEYSHLTGDEK